MASTDPSDVVQVEVKPLASPSVGIPTVFGWERATCIDGHWIWTAPCLITMSYDDSHKHTMFVFSSRKIRKAVILSLAAGSFGSEAETATVPANNRGERHDTWTTAPPYLFGGPRNDAHQFEL